MKIDGNGRAFPDGSSSSSNYCRNPTGDATGAWCYVRHDDDGGVDTDLCDVPGCLGDDSQTLLTDGGGGVHWLYVLPEWRNAPGLRIRLKRWSPAGRGPVSLRFRRAAGGPSSDLLQVDADRDETIKLFRARRHGDGAHNGTADQQTVYPHLLTAARWTELLFELVDGGGRTAVTVGTAAGGQIFRWTATDDDNRRVAFVGLSAAAGDGHVGARFPAEGETARTANRPMACSAARASGSITFS